MNPDIDWLCARYPSLSEAIVIAVCSEYDNEKEAEKQLRSINPNLNFDYDGEDDDNDDFVEPEVDDMELESPDEETEGETVESTDFEKRLEALITSHDKGVKPQLQKPDLKQPQKHQSPRKSPRKQNAPLATPVNFSDDVANISALLGLPLPRVEKTYHSKQVKASVQRAILELVLNAKTRPPTDADTEVIENTHLVYPAIPWPVIVRLCLFVQGSGSRAFEIAEKIASFDAWDELIIPEVEGIEEPSMEPMATEVPEQPVKFTRVGDKASTEKVRASMSLSQQSQHYDELQHVAKTNLLNTTDPAQRHEFQKTYNELRDKNHSVKKRIQKLTKPRNETLWYTDLHGLYVPEAMRVSKVKIESWWEVEKDNKPIRPLTLNTGLGSHSPGGFSKIKVALTKWLSIEGWVHEVHKGHIQVVRK